MEEERKKEEEEEKRPSLKSILGGDILAADFFSRQSRLFILILAFAVFYIHNRYAAEQEMIEIDRLRKELVDIKYDTLTRKSELMERSRQSRIEEYVSGEETELQTLTTPPYLIK